MALVARRRCAVGSVAVAVVVVVVEAVALGGTAATARWQFPAAQFWCSHGPWAAHGVSDEEGVDAGDACGADE